MKIKRTALAHRALSNEVRLQLFSLISEAEGELDVAGMAASLKLHPNTIRSHLRRLEEAGLVRPEAESRTTRGRPRLLWWLGPTARDLTGGARDYQLLATILAGHVHVGTGDPAGLAESAGRAWGGYLAAGDRPEPFALSSSGEAIGMISSLMERIGFEPSLEANGSSTKVLLHNCPFRAVAERYPDVVCALHLGIMRGALEETRSTIEARSLTPFVEPSLCIAELEEVQG